MALIPPAQHSQSLESWYTPHPWPCGDSARRRPADNYTLLSAAIRCDDPVVYMEHKNLWGLTGETGAASIDKNVPANPMDDIGKARVVAEGGDITIVTWSAMVHEAVKAAKNLVTARGPGRGGGGFADPLALGQGDGVRFGARRPGGLLIVHEAVQVGGFGAEIAATVADELFPDLKAPVKRLGAPRILIGYAPTLENEVKITAERDIIPAINSLVQRSMSVTNEMTGGEALAKVLQAHGVGPIFRDGWISAFAVLRCGPAARHGP